MNPELNLIMTTNDSKRTLVSIDDEPTYFIAGATVKFVSTPDDCRADLCVMEGSILPKAFVPLHKHPDPEVFHVLEGEIEFFVFSDSTSVWRTARAGDVINIPGDTKHAFRNTTVKPVRTIAVSGKNIYAFFREIVEPIDPNRPPAPPTAEQMRVVFRTASKYHYWMASPEENAAIGLVMPPPAS